MRVPHAPRGDVAIILSGGGARAAYQVGVLRGLARHLPNARPVILMGESAGAINAAYLAAHPGALPEAVEDLARFWSQLTADQLFRVDALSLLRNVVRWGTRLVSGGASLAPRVGGLLDTDPLRSLLRRTLAPANGEIEGIAEKVERGLLKAIALTTINYSTGQTVTWVQGGQIENWERPLRRSVATRLTIDHVLASAALPFLFPTVRLGDDWHGDGGVRLHTPLSPAIHLGAARILAVSTRTRLTLKEADRPAIRGYPAPAHVAGSPGRRALAPRSSVGTARCGPRDKDGLIMGLLAAEIMARTGRDPGEHYRDLTRELGEPVYERIDAGATPEEKAVLERLSAETLGLAELAGEPVDAVLTTAPGDGQPVGGVKIITQHGWCAARPSGTEAVYKLYAESFKGHDHLGRIQEEAQTAIQEVFRSRAGR